MEHRVILGGHQFLPFARTQVARLRLSRLDYATQHFLVDGAIIRVSISPGHEFIRIEGEPALYEFFTTGPTTEARNFGEYIKGYFVSLRYDKGTKQLEAVARGSNKEASAEDPPKWRFNEDPSIFPQHKALQVGAIPLPQYFPSVSPVKFNVNTWTSGSQADDLAPHKDRFSAQRVPAQLTDAAFDAPVTVFAGVGRPKGRFGMAPDSDWYRKSGVARVSSEDFGVREFGFLTDVSGVLHVFPTGARRDPTLSDSTPYGDQAIKTNIPEDDVVRKVIPHPVWARPFDADLARDQLAQAGVGADVRPAHAARRWEFNSDCTRMACVVAADMPRPVYGANADNPDLTGSTIEATESLPGMLEVSIKVRLTGTELNEFEVELETINEVEPADNRCIVGVGYYWGDLAGVHEPTGVLRDALLVVEMDVFHKRVNSGVPTEATFSEEIVTARVRDFASGTVLRTFVAHHEKAPYTLNNDPYSGSFLARYHDEVSDRTDNMIDAVTSIGLRATMRGIRQAFIDDFETVRLAPGFTCNPATVAQYEDKLQTCLAQMRDVVLNSSTYTGKEAFKAWLKNDREGFSLLHSGQTGLFEFWTSLLAFDLRIMAFAVQSAIFINEGDEVRRQDRIQVIVRNQVVDTIAPSGGEFSAKAAQYDGFSIDGAWQRVGCTETANPSLSLWAYRSINSSGPASALAIPVNRSDLDLAYPVGALLYSLRALNFTPCDPYDVFCIHPAGHWSICTRPVVRYEGVCKMLTPGRHYGFNHDDYDHGEDGFTQDVVDIISIQEITSDGPVELRSTHQEWFLKAYEKDASTQNALGFGLKSVTIAGGVTYKTTTIRTVGRTPEIDFEFIRLLTQFRGSAWVSVSLYRPIAYMDLRNYAGGSIVGDVVILPDQYVSADKRLTSALPVGRGAALFGNQKEVRA